MYMENLLGTRSGPGIKVFLLLSVFVVFSLSVKGQCPNLDVPVSPSPGDICIGDYGQVTISNSEQDVFYRAYIDDNAVSGQEEGTGGEITIIIPAVQLHQGDNVVNIKAQPNPAASGNVAIFETSVPPTLDGIPDEESWYLIGGYPNYAWGIVPSDTTYNAQWGAIYTNDTLYLAARVQDDSVLL